MVGEAAEERGGVTGDVVGFAPARPATSADQLRAERSTGIGGSDAHHLRWEAPWGCRRKLWFQKRGIPEDYPEARLEKLAPMERGHRLEDIAAELYAETTGRKIRRLAMRRKKDAEHLLVHADRSLVGGVAGFDGPGILEVKVPGEHAFWKAAREGLQPAYILQLQWGMMVTGYRWGSFAVFWADGWRLIHFDVVRDDALCAALEAEGHAFWREVEHGPQPSGLPADDARCRRCPYRKTCHGSAVPALPEADRGPVEALEDADLAALLADYDDAKALVDEDSAVLDGIKAAIKAKLGERDAIEVAGRRVYHRRAKDSVVLDTDGLRAVEPAYPFLTWILDPFRKVRKGARSLRVY